MLTLLPYNGIIYKIGGYVCNYASSNKTMSIHLGQEPSDLKHVELDKG